MQQLHVFHFVLSPSGPGVSAQRLCTFQSIKRRCRIPEKWHILAIMINKVHNQLLSKQIWKCHWLASF